MPRNGSGVMSKPAGTTAVANSTIESAKYNSTVDDIIQDLNDARPIVSGGTGATTAAGARTNLGVDAAQAYTVKTGSYTALASDNNAFHNFTGATPTLSLTAAATLGANWHYDGYASGGPVIIDPNAAELINGAATLTVPQYSNFSIKCDGTGFICIIDVTASGGTFTGPVTFGNTATLSADPSAALQPSTKQYADAKNALQSIAASVAANALTVNFTAQGPVSFRNPTLTSGAPVSATPSNLSLTVPSGATLGTVSTVQSQLVLILLYNGGTPALGIVNISGGANLDETGLISTTAMSAGATSASAVYSASAITNSPFRVVGYINSTQATAGTWATAPSLVQGAGGEAGAAMQSIGYGQTWQTVTRNSGTTYYNTTNKPIMFNAQMQGNPGAAASVSVFVNGNTVFVCQGNAPAGISATAAGTIIIPPGFAYTPTYTNTSFVTINELR